MLNYIAIFFENRKNKLKETDRYLFLEFLRRKIAEGNSFKKCCDEYLSQKKDTQRIVVAMQIAIELGTHGTEPAEILNQIGMLTEQEYTLLRSVSDYRQALPFLRNVASGRVDIKTVLDNEVKKLVWIAVLLMLTIIYFRSDIIEVWDLFNKTGSAMSTSAHVAKIEPPIILTNIYLDLSVLFGTIAGFLGIRFLVSFTYRRYIGFFYRIIPAFFYSDFYPICISMEIMSGSGLSVEAITLAVVNGAPNQFLKEVFLEAANEIKNKGETIYVSLSRHKRAFPSEVLDYIADASLNPKAFTQVIGQCSVFCKDINERNVENFKEAIPFIRNQALILGLGILSIYLTKSFMDGGITNLFNSAGISTK